MANHKAKNGFDYIVVGGGSAGCVVANRLSADPAVKVALIEAGPSDRSFPVNWKTSIPCGNLYMLPYAKYNWQYKFEAHQGVGGRELMLPRGKMLGGCSALNGNIYIRGNPADYDEWVSMGNPGWDWARVLSIFKKQENYAKGATPYHGVGGELQTDLPDNLNPIARAFIDAAVSVGHKRNDDPNGAQQDGFGQYPVTIGKGVRSNTSRAFLHPVWNRPNLTIITEALVERIILKGTRAVGVTIRHEGERKDLEASSEVVISSGAINSPQLLMLSGIGPAPHLEYVGVKVAHHLPGVGMNFMDHPTAFLNTYDPSGESYAVTLRGLPKVLKAPFQYAFLRKGMLASNALEAGGFMRSLPEFDKPDIQMSFMVGLRAATTKTPRAHGSMLLIHHLRPKSRGHLHLRSSDPAAAPMVHPDFLSSKDDVYALIRGLREARRILAAAPFRRFLGDEMLPGAGVQTDEQFEKALRQQASTCFHPAGTCKMGPSSDEQAVVDPRLRVHGIEGLRVADTSIMPKIVGGNTNAPAMMIGEQVASFILESGRTRAEAKPQYV